MHPGTKHRARAADEGATPAERDAAHSLRETIAFSSRIETYISNPRRTPRTGAAAVAPSAAAARASDQATVREIRRVAALSSGRCAEARQQGRSREEASIRRRVRARIGEDEDDDDDDDDDDGQDSTRTLLALEARGSCELAQALPPRVDDRQLARCCRFTDAYPLASYAGLVRYTPRLVNVVTLSDVAPVEGSTTTLPLDLAHIATHCAGAYFAPRRFAAVQLAMHKTPRARVLVFHTGRIVGTGTTGPVSARLAVMQAIQRLAAEADVHLRVKSFEVKNAVGAVTLGATINCEEFAQTHTDTVHYDRSSFVGMVRRPPPCPPCPPAAAPLSRVAPAWQTWRPRNSPVCAEIYSTGRVNIPGGKSLRDVLTGFARLVPELLEFSSSGGTHAAPATPLLRDAAAAAAEAVDDDGDAAELGLTEDLPGTPDLGFAVDLLAGWGNACEPHGLQPTAPVFP
jgi:TATA-box binding protein (TBP) (component of TFIID and TFIIIB)